MPEYMTATEVIKSRKNFLNGRTDAGEEWINKITDKFFRDLPVFKEFASDFARKIFEEREDLGLAIMAAGVSSDSFIITYPDIKCEEINLSAEFSVVFKSQI